VKNENKPATAEKEETMKLSKEEIKNRTSEAVNHLVSALEAGQSEILTQYLNAMSRFHNYSFGNIMLIARQNAQATNVAGVRTWNSLGRFVKRGEKGILILQQDGLRAHSATTGSPTAESTFSPCGRAPWHRTSRPPAG
jgi:hypothetical protein